MNSKLVLLSLIFIYSCVPYEDDDCHRGIGAFNDTDQTIYFMIEDFDGTQLSCLLPRDEVAPGEQEELRGPNTCWEIWIDQLYGGSMTVSILSVDSYLDGCDSTTLVNNVLEQREITVADLRRDGWVISYPQ
jgi:hypothetical protein